ncbi:hypothetical protein CYMTET_8723 [Cymbomonas tetramitiformis]|uniref:Uncharacterized protein n=1 Tax=Cymbomonas tetramitiformis TaxID=36881 RepID=A0AAE0GT19_9CHLO|nr:hypothetical protein CYMTET_8723 [Cymbomonas tetramitiformis]
MLRNAFHFAVKNVSAQTGAGLAARHSAPELLFPLSRSVPSVYRCCHFAAPPPSMEVPPTISQVRRPETLRVHPYSLLPHLKPLRQPERAPAWWMKPHNRSSPSPQARGVAASAPPSAKPTAVAANALAQ